MARLGLRAVRRLAAAHRVRAAVLLPLPARLVPPRLARRAVPLRVPQVRVPVAVVAALARRCR